MSRYIDADKFKKDNEELLDCDFPYLTEATLRELIDSAPTVDAVEVVRCEDCRWSDPMFGICKNPTTVRCEADINPDDYCSRAERKVK